MEASALARRTDTVPGGGPGHRAVGRPALRGDQMQRGLPAAVRGHGARLRHPGAAGDSHRLQSHHHAPGQMGAARMRGLLGGRLPPDPARLAPRTAAMKIKVDDLTDPAVIALLQAHRQNLAAISPPESMHALDLTALRQPDITFWTVWEDGSLLGCGALKELEPGHGEIKSM